MIPIVVITHGIFGQELLRTAQDIVGRQEAATSLRVTAEVGSEMLGASIDEVLKQATSDGILFLVDMLGGTPCNAAMMKTKDVRAEIVTGVNLYMLISAFRNRTAMSLEQLAAKVTEDAKRAVTRPKELLKKRVADA
jgi:mannose PTS system EIIA component